MSSDLIGYSNGSSSAPVPRAAQPGRLPGFAANGVGADHGDAIPWQRYVTALKRFKWLVLLIGVAGTAGGFMATRVIKPEYEVHATIWVSTDDRERSNSGPIRAADLLQGASWVDLLRSFKILDKVVVNLKLYVAASNTDLPLFTDVEIDERRLRPDEYVLFIDNTGRHYSLTGSDKTVIEKGNVGDSIGHRIGMRWLPKSAMLTPKRQVTFYLMTPRQAAIGLQGRLFAALPERGSLLRVELTGSNPQRTAATMNAVIQEFVDAAADLKRHNVSEFSKTLLSQLQYAERELNDAEMGLQSFRVNAITLPSEGTPVAGGPELTLNPIFDSFFRLKLQQDSVVHDREALERTLQAVQNGTLGVDAFWVILGATGGSQELRAALTEYSNKDSQLRTAQQIYTDEHKTVRDLKDQLQRLREVVIPRLVSNQLKLLKQRQLDLEQRIAGSAKDLRAIPTRTIEEMRLRQNVDTRRNLYQKLKDRFEEARLAEASTAADVTILDAAVPPQWPTQNTAPRIMMMALVGSFGAALFIAILLDRLDPRFRYINQATHDLGLPILGVIPKIRRHRPGRRDPLADAQLVETFRSLRLNVHYALPAGGPIALTVTSPGPSDGKSLVCSNLALAFADAGYRTLLIDGDIRRGALHSTFDVERTPGLVDYLRGAAAIDAIVRPTVHKSLFLVPCGQRYSRGPEALVSAQLPRLVQELQRQFDAIIIDSAPLGAGIDGFVLSATAGHTIIVLRTGETDRRLAKAKLELLDRLPTMVLGAIVNDVKVEGEYRYYSYLGKYDAESEDVTAALPSANGTGAVTFKS
jgi:polysaccharide biosynthesis transport protein